MGGRHSKYTPPPPFQKKKAKWISVAAGGYASTPSPFNREHRAKPYLELPTAVLQIVRKLFCTTVIYAYVRVPGHARQCGGLAAVIHIVWAKKAIPILISHQCVASEGEALRGWMHHSSTCGHVKLVYEAFQLAPTPPATDNPLLPIYSIHTHIVNL